MSINRIIEGLRYDEGTGQFLNSQGQTIHMFKGSPPIGSMWFLSLGGEVYQADTILYKLMTGKWVSSFRYKDGDSFHLSMVNIEPVTPKITYQMGPKGSSERGAASNRGEETTEREISASEEGVDPTAGAFTSEPGASSDEQELTLDSLKKLPQLYLFADGHLLNKATDDLITEFVTIKGQEYSLETIFYYSVTGVLCHEFEYLDGNPANKCFDNILPKDFVVETLTDDDAYLIRKYLEYEPEEECLLWVNRMYSNSLVGDILLFSFPKMTFGSYELVNLFGKIVPHRSVYKIVMSELGEEALESSDYVEPVYEVSPEGNDPYGREKVISCFYCGDNTAITRDHVIPVSMNSETRSYNEKDVVPCCRECNSLLGNKVLLTVEDRAMYLAERLTRRYASTLRAFGYGEDEINTFGPSLKSMISANVNMKSYIFSRIDHCHKIAGSLYSEESVSHLQGLSTRSKRAAYSVIDAFLFNTKSPDEVSQFADNHAREHGLEPSDIKQILNENLHPDVAIQFKFDHGYKLDVSLRQIKTVMLRGV